MDNWTQRRLGTIFINSLVGSCFSSLISYLSPNARSHSWHKLAWEALARFLWHYFRWSMLHAILHTWLLLIEGLILRSSREASSPLSCGFWTSSCWRDWYGVCARCSCWYATDQWSPPNVRLRWQPNEYWRSHGRIQKTGVVQAFAVMYSYLLYEIKIGQASSLLENTIRIVRIRIAPRLRISVSYTSIYFTFPCAYLLHT